MTKMFVVSGCVMAFLMVTACGMQYSRTEMDYGTSYKLSKFNQIANPEAEENLALVSGMDGQAAQENMSKYRKDFEKAAQAPVYSLSFGTVGSSTQR